jgi:serine/threonine protein kinase
VAIGSDNQLFGFRVIAAVGQGAASRIYAVQNTRTRQVWALKHVVRHSDKDLRFIEQVEQEHAVSSRLDHPNIRRVEKLLKSRRGFKVVEIGMLMEFIDAETVDRAMPESMIAMLDLFVQVAEALAHMHERGFVHADLKPTNIMVNDRGQVKLIDLGQAAPIGTVKKRIQGTPGYMAPEQAHREPITERTDVFNFGATMYWILTREVIPTSLPPKDESNSIASGAIDADRVPPPVPPHEKNRLVPEALSDLIVRCVKSNPAERPQSMVAVLRELEAIRAAIRTEAPAA